jgi:hypothetical protein
VVPWITDRGGELVAQIIVLCAFDTACALEGVLASVWSYVAFWPREQLLPESADPTIFEALPAHLLQSYSACWQFVNLCHRFEHGGIVALGTLAERHC